MKFTEIIW